MNRYANEVPKRMMANSVYGKTGFGGAIYGRKYDPYDIYPVCCASDEMDENERFRIFFESYLRNNRKVICNFVERIVRVFSPQFSTINVEDLIDLISIHFKRNDESFLVELRVNGDSPRYGIRSDGRRFDMKNIDVITDIIIDDSRLSMFMTADRVVKEIDRFKNEISDLIPKSLTEFKNFKFDQNTLPGIEIDEMSVIRLLVMSAFIEMDRRGMKNESLYVAAEIVHKLTAAIN